MNARLRDALTLKTADCLRSLAALRHVATMATSTSDALEIIAAIGLIEEHAGKARAAAYAWIESDEERVSA